MKNRISSTETETMKVVKKALLNLKNRISNSKKWSEPLTNTTINNPTPIKKNDVQVEIDMRNFVDMTPLKKCSPEKPHKKIYFECGSTTDAKKVVKLKLIFPPRFLERAEVNFDNMPLKAFDFKENKALLNNVPEEINPKDMNLENCMEYSITSTPLINPIQDLSKIVSNFEKSIPTIERFSQYCTFSNNDSDIVKALVMERFSKVFDNHQRRNNVEENQFSRHLEDLCEDTMDSILNYSLGSSSLSNYIDLNAQEILQENSNISTSRDTNFNLQRFIDEALTISEESDHISLGSGIATSEKSLSCFVSTVPLVNGRVNSLGLKAAREFQIILQTSRALSYCFKSKQFYSTIVQVEAERILLLASRRREILMQQMNQVEDDEKSQLRGNINISDVNFFLRDYKKNSKTVNFFVAIAECGTQVFASQVISPQSKIIRFTFDKKFDNLAPDFQIEISIYCLTLKKLNKLSNKANYSCPMRSQADGGVIRTSSFKFLGKSTLSINDVLAKYITLTFERPYDTCLRKYFNVALYVTM